jgi:hypothetical protein
VILVAEFDHAFAADQFAHLLLVAHRFGVDFLDVGDARALAHHVEIGEDVRIAGIVFVERFDVVEQNLGVTDDRPVDEVPHVRTGRVAGGRSVFGVIDELAGQVACGGIVLLGGCIA